MRTIFLLSLACVATIFTDNAVGEKISGNPELSISLGRVKGSTMTSRLGKTIYAFRGMRYGEAKRFELATAAKSWKGVFDASEEGPSCPRPAGRLKDEDCLRVNVYTTKLPAKASPPNSSDGTKRPVMVFFHPGGFYGYSGQSYLFGPHYLLDHDMLLVTINYRIGALGFLSTGDSHAPGNLGLKDQVLALRWVQNNIESFGGDKNAVTITGYSAGSWSVVLHILSPMSKDLFHRAIAMSGSPTKGELMAYNQTHYAKKQARLFNCPDETSVEIIQCLKTKNASEIASSFSQFNEWHFDPIRVWSPVVEPDIPGIERFIVAQPVDLIRQGKFNQVPLITGVTKDEFGYMTMQEMVESRQGNNSIFDDLNENWNHIAPISFQYERDTPRSRRISQGLRDFYFNGKRISPETVEGHANCYSDSIVGFPIHRLVHMMSTVSKQPVYYYRFIYQGRYSHAKWSDTKKSYGVVHHDDLLYLFYVSLFPYFDEASPEIPTIEIMTAMWSNFVKTGEPIPKNNKRFEGITWDKFSAQNNKYMEINETLTMKTGLHLDRMALFERLFPLNPLPPSTKH